jgi:hypothetical protein
MGCSADSASMLSRSQAPKSLAELQVNKQTVLRAEHSLQPTPTLA